MTKNMFSLLSKMLVTDVLNFGKFISITSPYLLSPTVTTLQRFLYLIFYDIYQPTHIQLFTFIITIYLQSFTGQRYHTPCVS